MEHNNKNNGEGIMIGNRHERFPETADLITTLFDVAAPSMKTVSRASVYCTASNASLIEEQKSVISLSHSLNINNSAAIY